MRLIDAERITKYKERLVVDADKINPEYRYVVDVRYIGEIPSVDAVPVVRCRECRYNSKKDAHDVNCEKDHDFTAWLSEDFYCADGKRREDGDA